MPKNWLPEILVLVIVVQVLGEYGVLFIRACGETTNSWERIRNVRQRFHARFGDSMQGWVGSLKCF